MISDYYIGCIHQVSTASKNSTGRLVYTYNNNDIKGYMSTSSDRLTSRPNYKFYTSTDVNIKLGDRIIYDGSVYEINGDIKNAGNKDHHWRITMQRIDGKVV